MSLFACIEKLFVVVVVEGGKNKICSILEKFNDVQFLETLFLTLFRIRCTFALSVIFLSLFIKISTTKN